MPVRRLGLALGTRLCCIQIQDCISYNLVPRAMPVRGLGLALALGKRNEIRNFIGCREINNLGAA